MPLALPLETTVEVNSKVLFCRFNRKNSKDMIEGTEKERKRRMEGKVKRGKERKIEEKEKKEI